MKCQKKYCVMVLCTLFMGLGTFPALSSAAVNDIASPGLDAETPAFGNAAQAQKAANLAQQAATSDTSLQNALQDVQDNRDMLHKALNSNDPNAISVARNAMAKAESAYTDALVKATGVISSDITAMRDSGMGWGVIAHELGVQPGLIGLGHDRGRQNPHDGMMAEPNMHGIDQRELAEATARNMESGWSRGHGVGIQAGVHEPGTGLSSGRSMGIRGSGYDGDHDRAGVSGAGGLGHGGNSDGSMGGTGGFGGDHGESSGFGGGATDSTGGPGNSEGHSNAGGQSGGAAGSSGGPGNSGDHGSAGADGSPGNSGSSNDHGNSGGMGGSGSSGGMGGSNSSGDHGDSDNHGGSDGRGW
ncbi:MAG: hypothetical protein JRJ37_06770 [Deltaproteobacteria bacterium]|nr:hypothetical protein [Deltaproteobacteria bacterium]